MTFNTVISNSRATAGSDPRGHEDSSKVSIIEANTVVKSKRGDDP